MKCIFKTKDPKESLRILKSLDMASAIFEIKINLRKKLTREAENMVFDSNSDVVEWVLDNINEELESIDINDLIE